MNINKGDKVALISPASGVDAEVYKGCLKIIEDLGLNVSRETFGKKNKDCYFLSSPLEERVRDLQEALDDDSRIIWAVAGGYGSYELLDKVKKPKQKKLIIGYSDLTVLLNYMADKWKFPVIYGACLADIARKNVSRETFSGIKDLIFNGADDFAVKKVKALNKAARNRIDGEITGGCASVLQVLLGTPQDINYDNKILLLEDDKNEGPARMHRIFDHFRRAKVFDRVKGVLLGSFLEQENYLDNKEMAFVIKNLGEELDKRQKPLFSAPNIGHITDMQSVPLGIKVVISG